MKRLLFFTLSSILFLASCEKDMSEENSLPPGTIVGGGTGSGGTGGTGGTTNLNNCKDCIYYPVCSGSVYHYSDTSSGSSVGVANDYTLTYVKDTTIDAKTYQKITGARQQNTFFNCTAGVSTAIILNGTTQGGSTLAYVKITTLKANEAVGASWVDIINNAVGQAGTYTYTIVSKGTPRTVAGITYSDVIHIHEQTTIDVLGNTIPAGQSEYYFARGTGLIESISIDDFSGTQILHHVLISAMIP